MIPTMILFGLILGRWWMPTLVLAAIIWPAVLAATGVLGLLGLVGAAALAVVNAAVGVLLHQGLLWSFRRLRGMHPPSGR